MIQFLVILLISNSIFSPKGGKQRGSLKSIPGSKSGWSLASKCYAQQSIIEPHMSKNSGTVHERLKKRVSDSTKSSESSSSSSTKK